MKLHLAGLRHWLDWLTQRGVLPVNPSATVRGEEFSRREGVTPILERIDTHRPASASRIGATPTLFDNIGRAELIDLRDRAALACMLFGFLRVGAVAGMKVKDFIDDSTCGFLHVVERGGQGTSYPLPSPNARLSARLHRGGIFHRNDGNAPIFRSAPRRSGKPLGRKRMLEMVKRRARAAGLSEASCNHSFRDTGITIHLGNGGTVEDAQDLANHADARTTRLYDRRKRKAQLAEAGQVQL